MKNSLRLLIALLFLGSTQTSFSQNTCATAVSVGCGTNETGTTTGAPNTAIGTCTTTQGTGGMQWYTFTGDGNAWTFETVATAGQYDTKIWVFSGSCGSLVCVTGNDDGGAGTLSLVNFTATLGTTYYVIVGGFSANEGNYDLSINSTPCNPVAMTFVSATTTQNNTSGITVCGSAQTNQEIIGVEVVTSGTLTPLTLQRIRIQTNGSTLPLTDISNIDIYYTGTSSTFATTTLYQSAAPQLNGVNIAFNANQTLAAGTNYFWVVYDVPATATVGNNLDALCNRVRINGTNHDALTVSDPVGNRAIGACPGDGPCSAYSITVGCTGSKLTGDNTGMTNSGISAPSCGAYAGGDIWYSITVPASGIVKVETYELTLSDVGMSIYSESGGCGGTLTEIACDDNSGFGNMTKTTLTGQTPGNTLYIRVWDNGNNQTGTFEIDVADMSTDYCVTGNSIDQGNGCAQLTPAANGQVGTIWDADNKFDFTSDFTYDFTVNLGNNDAGADGITFVIQNDPAGLSAAGGAGGSMGSGGITNSLIIEIDTYWNTEDRNDGIAGSACAGGTSPDHLDIWLNGDVNPGNCTSGARYVPNAVELLNGGTSYNIENGLDHTLRITYTAATQTITATVLNLAATLTYGTISYSPVDPMVLFGTNAPYFGFTASTGGLNNQQSACLAPSLVLPIELANFNANCFDGQVKLDWATLSEINNDYFTIEKSSDAINFEEVATINGAGNSNNIVNYSLIDNNPINSNTYYRLKQTDFNGEYSYSDLVTTSCKSKGDLTLYPNPSTGTFSFEYFSEKEDGLTIEIYNMAGQRVQQKMYFNLPKGMSKTDVDLGEIDNGIYFVNFSTSSNKIVHKLTIVN